MEGIRETLAENLRSWRETRGLTQGELAKKAGLTLQTVNKLEKKRRWVSDDALSALAKALDLPAPSMLFNSAYPLPAPIVREITPKEALEVLRSFVSGARVLSDRDREILAAFAPLDDEEASLALEATRAIAAAGAAQAQDLKTGRK